MKPKYAVLVTIAPVNFMALVVHGSPFTSIPRKYPKAFEIKMYKNVFLQLDLLLSSSPERKALLRTTLLYLSAEEILIKS